MKILNLSAHFHMRRLGGEAIFLAREITAERNIMLPLRVLLPMRGGEGELPTYISESKEISKRQALDCLLSSAYGKPWTLGPRLGLKGEQMFDNWLAPLLGGVLIGLSASVMLLFKGRITGISGIFYGMTFDRDNNFQWRFAFISGLLISGFVLAPIFPQKLSGQIDSEIWTLAVAGLLVGYGTRLGGGCTSGHGVCGLSRLSLRSLVATFTFMAAGILAVSLFRWFGVLPV